MINNSINSHCLLLILFIKQFPLLPQQITIGHLKKGNKRAMSKPEANYMWVNVDNYIQIIESRIDLINRKTDLYDPKFFLKTMMVVHRNHLILLENLCQSKNEILFSLCLSTNVHPLMNGFLSWKVVSIQGGIS